MEDTGHYNFSIKKFLLTNSYKVALINPLTTKNLRKATLKSVKSDKEDAILIAKTLLDKDYYHIASIQEEKLSEAKELTRYRTKLTIEMNRKKTILQRHVDIVFPEFNTLFRNEYTVTYLNILREYGDAYTIAHTDVRFLRISKYQNVGKLIKFAEVNPYISESGEFSADKTIITKKGSKYLRTTLYRVIIPVILFNPVFHNYYHLKRRQGKGHLCSLGIV